MTAQSPSRFPTIPDRIRGLSHLALDIRWSWNHAADRLWKRLDPTLWSLTHNPWLVLQTVSEKTLEEAAEDEAFCRLLDRLLDDGDGAGEAQPWFPSTYGESDLGCVAYFSMEFGLSEALPVYSGGLGLLAGDHLKAASDLGVPVVGVGILYQYGYFRQALDPDGSQIALYPANNPSELPLVPVRDSKGNRMRLEIEDVPWYSLWVRVWQARVGNVTLYLLDLNDPANPPVDRCITNQLYGGGSAQRLQQEMLLGIAGWRVLRAVGINPEVCHLNEGHAAFAVLERARFFMRETGQSFDTALATTRAGNLFTTHTPVSAGFDRFSPQLIERHFFQYVEDLGISFEQLLDLGRQNPGDPGELFNMAYLAIRGSHAVNGVSRLHGEVSKRIFAPLFHDWPVDHVPVGHVTNGVHVPSWDSAEADALWTELCGKDRWTDSPELTREKFLNVSNATIWRMRAENRRRLVNYVRRYYSRQLWHYGGEQTLGPVEHNLEELFDPNALTLGFARRFATYKRPTLMLTDPDRLARILSDSDRPVQLIIAGKAHPRDEAGKSMIREWVRFSRRPDVHHRVIFISDYDILLAERLVQGVDVWINNPRRPSEASGTSGMKILVNGGLNLSELDGWWAEAYAPELGWAIGDGEEHDDDPAWDRQQAEEIYALLEDEIVPSFYDRDEHGVPGEWVARIRESMARLTPHFSTNRMVREYTEKYYLSCATAYRRRVADNGALGAEIRAWQKDISLHLANVRMGSLHLEEGEQHHHVRLQLYLGDLAPEFVAVQIVSTGFVEEMTMEFELDGAVNGFSFASSVPADRPVSDYRVRLVPSHPDAAVPLECDHVRWLI